MLEPASVGIPLVDIACCTAGDTAIASGSISQPLVCKSAKVHLGGCGFAAALSINARYRSPLHLASSKVNVMGSARLT